MFSALLLCFFFVTVWLVYTHYFKPYYVRKVRLPGPSPKVFSGNYSEMASLGCQESTEKWMSKYGPTFICYFGIKPMIVTQDLEIIKSIMVKNFDSFINRSYIPPLLKKGKVRGLLQLRDEEWRRVRRILMPAFSIKKLRMMSPLIQESCERLRDKMAEVSDTGSSVDVWEWFGMYTMEVILATAFSRDISSGNGEQNPLVKAAISVFQTGKMSESSLAVERLTMFISHFPWSVPILRFLARRTRGARSWDYLEETALKLIEDRRNTVATTGTKAQDLLQSMLEMHDEYKETKSDRYLSNDEIVATINVIMLAGYETTSDTLSYTAYLLALNPTIQDKLIKEINSYYASNPNSSLYDAAEGIEYVTMTLYESLRMYPPAPRTSRECKQTCAVTDDLIIQKGVDINIPIFLLHRNPKYWPNPDTFDPERFNPNNEASYPAYSYLPFGEGPRNCIGRRLGMLEAKMALVAILKDFHFKKSVDTEVPLKLGFGISMSPRNGIKLTIVSNPI